VTCNAVWWDFQLSRWQILYRYWCSSIAPSISFQRPVPWRMPLITHPNSAKREFASERYHSDIKKPWNNIPVRAHPLRHSERRKWVDDRGVPVGVTRVGRATTRTPTDIQNQNELLSGLVNVTRRAGRSMRRGRFERLDDEYPTEPMPKIPSWYEWEYVCFVTMMVCNLTLNTTDSVS